MAKLVALAAMTVLLAGWLPCATADDAATEPAGKCMMWTAKSKTATAYMVGSLHEGTTEMYPLPREMEDAFVKANLLVEEIKESKDDDKLFNDDYLQKMQYTGSDTLPGHLTAEQWKDVKSACEQVGFSTDAAEKLKPEPLCLVLKYDAGKKAGKWGGVGPPGIDDYFATAAKKRNMPMDAFETLEFQVNLVTFGPPEKVAVPDLLEEVSRIKGVPAKKEGWSPAKIDLSVAMWSSGDTDAIGKWVRGLAAFDPGWARHLLFDRNSRMADKIEQYLQGNKTVFVVVGCLHFVGDRGIVQLLRDDNIDVQQSPATKSDRSK
jgi:uncharacterized protein YbaP (TraB family)